MTITNPQSQTDPMPKSAATPNRPAIRAVDMFCGIGGLTHGLRDALPSNPYLKQWYDALRLPHLKEFANKIFGDIDKAGIDELPYS